MPSENGWEPPRVGPEACEWVTVPGTNVSLQLQRGWPAAIMRAFAADYNAFVEPLRDPDSASWTPTNAVPTSNHLNATAMDLNWDSHPFQRRGTFNSGQMRTIRELLDWYEDTIYWGGDWNSPIDEMHWQMGYGTFNNPHTGDFITRKIRRDGFSTFRRGATVPESNRDRYIRAVIDEGRRLGISPKGITIAIAAMLVESNIKMYANSNDPPSLNFPHDAVGSDHMSSGLFQQQPPWGSLECRMDPTCSARLFFEVDNGPGVRGLTKIRAGNGKPYDYNSDAHSPGFYAQKVQGSAFPDRYDQRWDEATAIYNQYASGPVDLGDDMAQVPQEQWDRFYREWVALNPIRDMYRTGDEPRGTLPESIRASQTFGWEYRVESSALRGEAWAISLVTRAANGILPGVLNADGTQNKFLVDHAKAVLDEINSRGTTSPPSTDNEVQNNLRCWQCGKSYPDLLPFCPFCGAPQTRPNVPPPQPVPEPAPLPVPVPETVPEESKSNGHHHFPTTGELIGNAYDALEALRLADALPIESRAPLAALIAVLQTKNGSQIQ